VLGGSDDIQFLGGRTYGVSYIQDGQASTNAIFGTVGNSAPGLDAISEVQVLSNSYSADGDRLRHGAQLQLHVHERGAGRAEHHAGLLGLLEVGGGHLDAVGAGPQVRGLEAALGVGLHGARHARGLVDDEDGGAGDGRPLGIHDRPADGPQEGLGGRVSRDAQGQEQGHKDPCSHLVLLRRGSCRSGWKSQENDSCLAFYTFSLAAVKLFLWAGA